MVCIKETARRHKWGGCITERHAQEYGSTLKPIAVSRRDRRQRKYASADDGCRGVVLNPVTVMC